MNVQTLVIIIGATGTVCSVIFGYIGYQRGLKKECTKSGEVEGEFKTDMKYVKRRVDDVLFEQRDTNRIVTALGERVTRVEESAKSAHHRIDEIVSKGK